MSVCSECCVLSGRGLCFGLITRPEESCRTVVCRCVCSKNVVNEEALSHRRSCVKSKPKETNSIRVYFANRVFFVSLYDIFITLPNIEQGTILVKRDGLQKCNI
jgi:hypothetical protein